MNPDEPLGSTHLPPFHEERRMQSHAALFISRHDGMA